MSKYLLCDGDSCTLGAETFAGRKFRGQKVSRGKKIAKSRA